MSVNRIASDTSCNALQFERSLRVPKRDTSQEALRQVEQITDSKPVRGETLLRSRKLKRQLAEARKRLKRGRTPRN